MPLRDFLLSIIQLADKSVINHLLSEDLSAVSLINQGMTNRNFLINTNNRRYVVRVPGNGTNTFINREHEWENYQLMSGLEISVEEIYYNKDTSLRITPYIEDTFNASPIDKNKITVISRLLKKVHRAAVVLPGNFRWVEKLHSYEATAQANRIILPSSYYQLKENVMPLASFIYETREPLCPCHNDPVPENFIGDPTGTCYLIDWEYGGMNVPSWDLAAVVLEYNLTPEQTLQLLSTYYQDASIPSDAMERVIICGIYQDLLWYLWAMIMSVHGKDYCEYGNERLKRAQVNAGRI